MSGPACAPVTCKRPCWVMAVLVLICLAVMAWWAMGDPLLPDEDECRARGRAADCWRDEYPTPAPIGNVRPRTR